jgi:ribosomal protein L24E
MKRLTASIALLSLCAGFVIVVAPSGTAAAATSPPVTLPLSGLSPAPAADTEALMIRTSCPTAGSCVALGEYSTSDKSLHPLVETLSNGSWSARNVPVPAGVTKPDFELNDISCANPTSCVAVGEATGSSGDTFGIIETLSNGSWSATRMPLPSDADTSDNVDVWSVSCPSVGQCVAVGSYVDKSNNTDVLIGTLTHAGWTASTLSLESFVPAPRPLHYQWLRGISCPKAGSCVASGDYEDVNSHMQLFTATLSDGTWSLRSLSLNGVDPPAAVVSASKGVEPFILSMSCPSTAWCVVIGEYEPTSGGERGFISTLSAGRWTSATPPLTGVDPPASAVPADALYSVSCPQVRYCIAVGAYEDSRHGVQILVETLSGRTWSATTGSAGLDGPGISIEAVANPGETVAGLGLPGASATALARPNSYGVGANLFGVSCPLTGPCVSVGWYGESDGKIFPMAETISNPAPGYWEVASDGGIFSEGSAHFYGSMGGTHLNKPVVGISSTPEGGGYWEVASDGGIFSFGDAKFHGSMGNRHLNEPVVGIASTPSGAGYWEVASDGGIFSFGDAKFHGSMGNRHLNEPVVGIASTPDGKGYWEVASDGGIFSFGDARFHGSMGAHHLNEPVVGIASTPDGKGYWEVASDGGIFNFGDAPFHGSMGGTPLNQPVVGIASTTDGGGYWEVAADGGVFAFGDAPFVGSLGHLVLNKPIVGVGVAG